jgi:hypothetical protein
MKIVHVGIAEISIAQVKITKLKTIETPEQAGHSTCQPLHSSGKEAEREGISEKLAVPWVRKAGGVRLRSFVRDIVEVTRE